jgi:hypothetical protein
MKQPLSKSIAIALLADQAPLRPIPPNAFASINTMVPCVIIAGRAREILEADHKL